MGGGGESAENIGLGTANVGWQGECGGLLDESPGRSELTKETKDEYLETGVPPEGIPEHSMSSDEFPSVMERHWRFVSGRAALSELYAHGEGTEGKKLEVKLKGQ